ncbi:MAG: PEP-CTERM sorting domain-containing protein [Pirellulales bacterium]
MKINLRKATASVLTAAGLLWGGTSAMAMTSHVVGDPGFQLIGVGAPGFYYFQGPPNSPFWEKTYKGDPGLPGSGIGSNWAYNTAYATGTSPNRPDPIGSQSVHGQFAYNHQILTDTFEAGNTYTYSAHVQGDANAAATEDSLWLYMFADSVPTLASGGLDALGLANVRFNQSGSTVVTGPATVGPFSGFNRNGGSAWTEVSMSYTATAADDGKKIGLAFWGRNRVAFDDVALSSVPEPATALLLGTGLLAGSWIIRRRRED